MSQTAMAPSPVPLTSRHGPNQLSSEPLSGLVISVALSMLSISVLSGFMTQRYLAVKTWKQLPFVQWLVLAIYADSSVFVFATAILQFGFGVGYSGSVCESAILLCLACYVTTKIVCLIYLFLVEKAYIIRSGNKKPRLKSKLYICNSFGMIGAYCIVVVPNFVLRFARIENGECIIGLQRPAMIPLIVFDLVVNVYLTIIFLKPLSGLYSYKNSGRAPGSRRLKTMATKTFIGCVCTLASSIVNLSVLVGLNGEPGWVCLMCCNSDILFSAIVIHWVTSRDSTTSAAEDIAPSSSGPRSQQYVNTTDNTGPGTGTGARGDELSPIPPRATRHRLPSTDTDTDEEVAKVSNKTTASTIITTTRIKSHISVSTDAEEAMANKFREGDAGDASPSYTASSTTNSATSAVLGLGGEDAKTQPFSVLAMEEMGPPPVPVRNRAVSEVRVDVDYGATTSTLGSDAAEGVAGEVRLGNEVVIGSKSGAGSRPGKGMGLGMGVGRQWGRSSPWG